MPEEKIFTIPLAESKKKSRVKRAPYAARIIRDFIKKHTKVSDIRLGQELNRAIWSKGIKKPPHSIRVTVAIEKGIAKAELFGHAYMDFKPQSVAKREKFTDKLRARLTAKEMKHEEEQQAADKGRDVKEVAKEIEKEDQSGEERKGSEASEVSTAKKRQ